MNKGPLLVVRHGRTDWNDAGRLQGHTDVPLNAEGLAGARRAALSLRRQDVRRILTSPLIRASHTAEIIGLDLGIVPEVEPLLIERNFGPLEGRFVDDITAELRLKGRLATADGLPAGSESWPDLRRRAEVLLHKIDDMGPVLLVSHYATLIAIAEVMGTELDEPQNCAILDLRASVVQLDG